jgi:hypothetical protein
MIFQFSVDEKTGKKEIAYDLKGAVLCGYTGRDQTAVRQHIEELAKEGVDPPPSVPAFYPKAPWGLTCADAIQVEGRETSGEVEFFLLIAQRTIYAGVASDHTDRNLERINIRKSKQTCPAILSSRLWNYEEVKSVWDQVHIRSWAYKDGHKFLYQDSTLGSILPPEDLIRQVQQRVSSTLDGIAIFSGTPPLASGEMIFADRFEGELIDAHFDRRITIGYSIKALDWFIDSQPL